MAEETHPSAESEMGDNVVKMRGLPWSVSGKEILEFLNDCKPADGENSVRFTFTKDGRPSGECFVELADQDELEKALKHDNEHMGKRYIEVFKSKQSQMEWVCERMPQPENQEGEAIVRLRGLPFGCSKTDIASFFEGLEIAPYGITITLDQDGRCTGDAYVEFVTPECTEAALKKHKEKIGHRYIEIFKSSKTDIKYVVGPKPKPLMSLRPSPYDRPSGVYQDQAFVGGRARGRGFDPIDDGFSDPFEEGNFGNNSGSFGAIGSRGRPRGGGGGRSMGPGRGGGGRQKADTRLLVSNSSTGHSIHMRGLPFEATESDIYQFLSPLNPVSVRVLTEPNGRAKGEADVDFVSHDDAVAAMQKDRQNIGHRYIELFLQSTQGGSTSWKNSSSSVGSGGGGRGGGFVGMGRGGGRNRGGYEGGPSGFKDPSANRGGGGYGAMSYGGGGYDAPGGAGYYQDSGQQDTRFNQPASLLKQETAADYGQGGRGGYSQPGGQAYNAPAYGSQQAPMQMQELLGGSYAGGQQQQQAGGGAPQRAFNAGGSYSGGAVDPRQGSPDAAARSGSSYGSTADRQGFPSQYQGTGNGGAAVVDSYSAPAGGAYSAPANSSYAYDTNYATVGGSNFFAQSAPR